MSQDCLVPWYNSILCRKQLQSPDLHSLIVHYFCFVLCSKPFEVRTQMYIWFVFFLANCSLISMLWNFLQFPLWWRSTVCMYVALKNQFNLCTQYIYTVCVLYMLMHSQICSFKSVIALCSLNFVWIMHSNFISLCLWGSLIQAVTPHESLLLTRTPYKMVLTVELLL